MRVRIHRGAQEIGGNCVELAVDGSRLLLDLGRPLNAAAHETIALPEIDGLAGDVSESLLGVIVSHPHQDHYGLLAQTGGSLLIYMGAAAARIVDEAAFFSPSGLKLTVAGFLEDRKPFTLGPFTITPYLVDHSAFDAYALLVESAGRRLFYSGDFRTHGRKGALMTRLCAQPPVGVDTLILEGTHVRASAGQLSGLDESHLELELARRFRATRGLVAVFSSAQNIDRLVSIYRACLRTERTLLIDLYTATIAAATGNRAIPQPGFPRLRVYVPNRQRLRVIRTQEFSRMDAVRDYRIFPEEIRHRPGQFTIVLQGSTVAELADHGCLDDASAIWSLWPGYLDGASGQSVLRTLQEHHVPLAPLHSSGHARIEDLQGLASAIAPERVVPIHTSEPKRFVRLFERVELRGDGEWWDA